MLLNINFYYDFYSRKFQFKKTFRDLKSYKKIIQLNGAIEFNKTCLTYEIFPKYWQIIYNVSEKFVNYFPPKNSIFTDFFSPITWSHYYMCKKAVSFLLLRLIRIEAWIFFCKYFSLYLIIRAQRQFYYVQAHCNPRGIPRIPHCYDLSHWSINSLGIGAIGSCAKYCLKPIISLALRAVT